MKKNDPSIQKQINNLNELVAWFENEDFELEQATTKLKQAVLLATQIEENLNQIANEIVEVKKSFTRES